MGRSELVSQQQHHNRNNNNKTIVLPKPKRNEEDTQPIEVKTIGSELLQILLNKL